MQPGNMTTKFVGVKMSRYQAPYASGYYSVPKESSNSGSSSSSYSSSSGGSYGSAPVGGSEMIRNIFGGQIYKPNKNPYGVDRGKYHHNGTDLPCREGTCLYAPWDGYVVTSEFNNGGAGNWIWFKDVSGKNMLIFMHCKERKVSANSSKLISKGTLLALSGNTGHSSGAHLHLELYINGRFKRGGELTKYGGPCQAVDPMVFYGYTDGSGSANASSSTDTSSSSSSGSSKDKAKSTTKNSKNTVNDGICILGDSWSAGLEQYFQYKEGAQGIGLQQILNKGGFLDKALKTNAKTIVVYCGINDTNGIGTKLFVLANQFAQIGKRVSSAKKKCYICTYPTLKYPSGENYCVTEFSVNVLNTAINDGGKNGLYKVITVPDSVTNGNVDGFHLTQNGYKKVADYIHNWIKKNG